MADSIAKPEKRVNVQIVIKATELKGGDEVSFCDYDASWKSVPVTGFQIMQKTLLETMIGWGDLALELAGHGEALETFKKQTGGGRK